jgi:WhiB family redox-sensing transcriptional regulator
VPDPATSLVLWLMAGRDDHELPTLEDLVTRPAWMAEAACRGQGTSAWFVEVGGNLARAREVCAGCPVQPECLGHALEDPELVGCWGGTSWRERRAMRKLAG